MQPFSPDALYRSLQSLDVADDSALCVAFSGGLDSTVLLHALARSRRQRSGFSVRAVHVDHQLHPASGAWRARCEATAASLGIRCDVVAVRVIPAHGGVEAAARRARYDALRERVAQGETLLTAHHADDQLESVLMALVRGAGVAGLSGVRSSQPFGRGRLVRPLLVFTRAELEAWARAEGLSWIDDPANQDASLDRNFLRIEVAPALRSRWPAAARAAARSAAHIEEAHEILAAVARADLAQIAAGEQLEVARLLALEPARRRNVLRHWMRGLRVKAPSTRKLLAIERDLLTAAVDRIPSVCWDDVVLRRHRGLLYLERQPAALARRTIPWNPDAPLELPGGLGRLRLQRDRGGRLDVRKLAATLEVRFRAGGERLRPVGELHRRSLKKMLQAAGVPPWVRERLPLIYSADRLAAVGDLWVADEFAARNSDDAARIVWEKPEADSG